MRFFYVLIFLFSSYVFSQKKIHVFVSLCDNLNQGIVPVSEALGNGQNPKSNLYWGVLYGMKTYFKRSLNWKMVKSVPSNDKRILERILFKHKTTNTYLLADAYDGKYIKQCTIDFLKAVSGDFETIVNLDNRCLKFGKESGLISYIGHDGLMEFDLHETFPSKDNQVRDAIVLACFSQGYFNKYLSQAKANPLVWSVGLMSPEAYTLKWAIDGWIKNESNEQIRERAAQAYNSYQKCGIRGARRLLVTGY